MRALVTGGAGFIGSNLVDALLDSGAEVLAFDDLSTGRAENLAEAERRGASLFVGDVTDRKELHDVVSSFAPDAVFHLAAQIDIRRSVADPGFDAKVNIVGTLTVLEALRLAPASPPLIFVSTGGAIYGEGSGQPLPLDEDADCLPLAPYGQSKLAAEGYVSLYSRLYGLPAVSLRLANVYGPRQDPLGEAGVVAIFCGRLLRDEPPVIFGDGLQTRDYLYVGDVVVAALAAHAKLQAHGRGYLGTFNIGTGRETDVLRLARLLGGMAELPGLEPRMEPPRQGEVQRISLDSTSASEVLGWSAETPLEEGLERTLEAVRNAGPG